MIVNPVFTLQVMIPVTVLLFASLLIGALRHPGTPARRVISVLLAVLICSSIFTINLRVMKKAPAGQFARPNLDVLFVVDNTISMWAKDYGNGHSRMDGVVETVDTIMDGLQGSSFALVNFDTQSSVRLPLTQDAESIHDAMTSLYPPSQYLAKGSSLNVPHDDMKRMLARMGLEKNHKRIVFFCSDGEITNGDQLISYRDLSSDVDGGAVLCFGSEKGASMRDLENQVVYDPGTYDKAVSKIDEQTMRAIAADLGITYLHVGQKKDVNGIIAAELLKAQTVFEAGKGVTDYEDTYYVLLPVLLLCFCAELILFKD